MENAPDTEGNSSVAQIVDAFPPESGRNEVPIESIERDKPDVSHNHGDLTEQLLAD